MQQNYTLHNFHIPVMGLAYTIDSPIKVAQYGISSVISIVEDKLIEMMRKVYYPQANRNYYPILATEPDYRAKRITDYLNLLNDIVQKQIEKMSNAAFDAGSEIVKYFELLPEDCMLKKLYLQMNQLTNSTEKEQLQQLLRKQIRPGSIDVNIMTKIDRDQRNKAGELVQDGSDAIAALRGYANSNLCNSSVIFSAGMNPRLFSYLENVEALRINADGSFSKRIIIKVSDYRSALIQGKMLAKKGIWVSEFRIESGLNCGGHAFATDGFLLGPILEEFKLNRQQLQTDLFALYNAAVERKGGIPLLQMPKLLFSVQGGIGTANENKLLQEYYGMDSIGWGTPFLLVPEATTVDENTLKQLCNAKENDLVLSHNSPLGVRFHYLKGTSSEIEKAERITKLKPGSPCTEKHLALNTEFTKEPICTASKKYIQLKIAHLQSQKLSDIEYQQQVSTTLSKECLCIGLSNSAAINYKQVFVKSLNAVTICPGPNIVNFAKIVSLKTMVNHIYGRTNIMINANRPHVFIAELNLYIDYLAEQLKDSLPLEQVAKLKKYYTYFFENLKNGILYYRNLACLSEQEQLKFQKDLNDAELTMDFLNYKYAITVN
ncbi:MAG: hypothetical protein Q8K64_10530 [Sediminibacterium sp.]|nr:hypothetical protein [Sediminibacterium sp.]TXT32709.1 MAG: hypothetical protein FD136_1264 [Chitinophagaceae bacterium]